MGLIAAPGVVGFQYSDNPLTKLPQSPLWCAMMFIFMNPRKASMQNRTGWTWDRFTTASQDHYWHVKVSSL